MQAESCNTFHGCRVSVTNMEFLVICTDRPHGGAVQPQFNPLLPNAAHFNLVRLSVTLIFLFVSVGWCIERASYNSLNIYISNSVQFFSVAFHCTTRGIQLFVNKVYILYILCGLDSVHWDSLRFSLIFNRKTKVKKQERENSWKTNWFQQQTNWITQIVIHRSLHP